MPRRSTRKRTKKKLPDQDSDEEYGQKRRSRRPPTPPTPPPQIFDDEDEQEEDQRDLDEQEDSNDNDPFAAEEEDEEEVEDEEDEEQEQGIKSKGKRAPIILRLVVPKQPPSNLYCGPVENADPLELPPSSEDLPINNGNQLMQALSIHEILRLFGYIIRLSPFRFEDFCSSLMVDEQSNLLSEIHIQLLRTCIREDKQQQTWIVPAELRDSINVYLHLCDTFDWPAALRLYLSADERENGNILDALHTYRDYPFEVDLQTKLDVLQLLCNQFLLSSFAREDIVNGGIIRHDDICRLCHKNGELLPCDSCPAAYHTLCTDPPATVEEIALEKPWNCPVCVAHRVKGVTDCVDPVEKSGYLKRKDILGWDRHGRRYWFLSRRIFVVDENETDVRYYSTRKQFEELLSLIDGDHHEKYLFENLTELKQHILSQMEITEEDKTLCEPYKNYQNQFTINVLALNKHQHSDNDPNRSLGNKFSINSGSAFKWHGAITGTRNIMAATVRNTLLKLESLLPQAFMHPNWSHNRTKWIRMVNIGNSETEFANALCILESCIKPVLFRIAWIDNLGTLRLHKTTFLEREELKKTDRQPRGFERREYLSGDFELSIKLGTAVKFSSKLKPVKHKVWKQKGEEYRLTGLNGWSWLSSTYRSRPTEKPKSYQNINFKYIEPIHSDPSLTENVEKIVQQSEVIDISENLKASDSERFLYTKKPSQSKKLRKVEELYKVVEAQVLSVNGTTNQNSITNCNVKSIVQSTKYPPRPMKGELPKCHDFLTYKGKIRSLLVLPKEDLSQLARVGGLRETKGFSYNAKQNNYVWPYSITPRPVFRTCWLYKNRIVSCMHEVALQLRILYACIRWEDLQARPPASGNNVIVTDEETITIELLKRRDKPPNFIRSDYLIRKTIVPIEQPTKYRKVGKSTPSARSGLRARRRQDEEEERTTTKTEVWVPEEHLELWELKQFDEKMERVNQLAKEKAIREEAERKRLSEEQARRSRLAAAQQKRNSTITQQPTQLGPRILPTTPIIHRTTPIIVNKSMRPLFITFRPNSNTPTSAARTFIINVPRNATTIKLPPNIRLATTGDLTQNVMTTSNNAILTPTTAIFTPTTAIPTSGVGNSTPTIALPSSAFRLATPTATAKQATSGKPTTIMFPPTTLHPVTLNVSPKVTNSTPTSINLISTTPKPNIPVADTVPITMSDSPKPTVTMQAPIAAEPEAVVKSEQPEVQEDLFSAIDLPSDMLDVPDSILEEPSYTIEVPSNADETQGL